MSNSRVYWNSNEQLEDSAGFAEKSAKEFAEPLPVDEFLGNTDLGSSSTSRRDFLKFMGFSIAAASLAACEAPVIKSIPYVSKPEEITPGVANYYASSFYDGFDFANILVKTREGRPIYIESNKQSKYGSALNARINSSVLSLYDSARYMAPKMGGNDVTWSEFDKAIKADLEAAKAKGGNIRILSNSIASPSTMAAVDAFKAAYGAEGGASVEHVMYDSRSYSGMLDANMASFGKRAVPMFHMDQAKVVVSFDADFLNGWTGAQHLASGYASRRNPDGEWMNRHYQFETNFSLTGTNADVRGALKPSEMGLALLELHNEIAAKVGGSKLTTKQFESDNNVHEKVKEAAKDLLKAKGHSLVLVGANNKDMQMVANNINQMLMNVGSTIDFENTNNLRKGDDKAMQNLVSEMKSGSVDALIMMGCNPAYDAAGFGFPEAMAKVKTTVSSSVALTETAEASKYVAAENHYLESWNDMNAFGSEYSITQPTIKPIFDTRQSQESLLRWSGSNASYYDFVRENWTNNMLSMQSKYTFADAFWNATVHDGVMVLDTVSEEMEISFTAADNSVAANVVAQAKGGAWEVSFYNKVSMGDGSAANNPWLQELADPVTRITWDNYATMNPADMKDTYNIDLGQELPATVATVTVNGKSVDLPVVAVPGQKVGTIGVALGYGRKQAGKVVAQGDSEGSIGADVYPLLTAKNGSVSYTNSNATVTATDRTFPIATLQSSYTMMGRKIVNETSLKTYTSHDRDTWNPKMAIPNAYGEQTVLKELDLWNKDGKNDQDIPVGHRWGMIIDLNACNGCGACITACHSENNVPVVGKDEVRRVRSMSWLRVDRYFSSDMTKVRAKEEGIGKIDMYLDMEDPSLYPEAVYQPVMCQHCNHAPCETVCPVAATTHSNEGMNQMTYNRCIGTRYCANNCPYKVRRFNWFNYQADTKFEGINPTQDPSQTGKDNFSRMVLNPDVTVRSRGVMEKCSLCVQRIQAGKLVAKKAGEPVQDGAIQTACSASCTNGAITFGDLNAETRATKKSEEDRSYHLLEEVGTQPNIFYQTKVRNLDEERVHEALAAHAGGGHSEGHHGEDAGHSDEHETHESH